MLLILLILLSPLLCSTQNEKKEIPEIYIPPYPTKPNAIKYYLDRELLKFLIGFEDLSCFKDEKHDNPELWDIQNLMEKISNHTCLKFEKQNKTVTEIGINFFLSKDKKNHITLSRSNKTATNVSLLGEVYIDISKFRYFFGLALGLMPEIQRIDRDIDLDIYWKWIERDLHLDYEKSTWYYPYLFSTDLDFTSAMMVQTSYGSTIGMPTFKSTLYPYYEKMMEKFFSFTFSDYRKLNYIYCNKNCKQYNNCTHGGYYYDGNCTKCTCPDVYEGPRCENLKETAKNCTGSKDLIANSTEQEVEIENIDGVCFYNITSSNRRRKVQITVEKLNIHKEKRRQANKVNLEVRYRDDKGVKGVCFDVDVSENFTIPAASNEVVVKFSPQNNNGTKLKFAYKQV